MSSLYFHESPELKSQRYINKRQFDDHLRRSGSYVEEYSGIPICNISKPTYKPSISIWLVCNRLYHLPSYVDDIHTKTTQKSIYSQY